MENIQTTEKLNNEGFTLVELLVALAISGVVIVMIAMFMTNGSNMFRTERGRIDLQNEMQMADSFVTQTLMEAKTLDITNTDGSTTAIYTGNKSDSGDLVAVPGYDDEGNEVAGSITSERIMSFDKNKKSLYVSKSYYATPKKGNLVSDNVTNLIVSIDDSCKVYKAQKDDITNETTMVHAGYQNPIVLNVTLVVSDEKNDKLENVTIKLRNKLKKVVVDGVEYTVK